MKLKSKQWLALILVFCMVIVAGCQAVAGVDFNEVIKKMTKVTSAEGKSEFEFKLNLNEEELRALAASEDSDPEETEQFIALLKQLSHVKIALDEYKVQDQFHASMKGALTLGDQTEITFDLKMSDTLSVIKLGGAKQSFSFDLTGEHAKLLQNHYYETEFGISYDELYGEDELELAVTDEEMLEAMHKMSELVTDFSVGHLPNIERLSVNPVTETINGESTSLLAIQGELQGMELWNWAKKLISSLANDREGLEKLLEGIFEIMSAQDSSLLSELALDELSIGDYKGDGVWENEELGVDLVAPTPEEVLADAVEEIIAMLSDLEQSMIEIEQTEQETLKQVLNDSLLIKFNYGIDSDLNVRKQQFSVNYEIDPTLKEELELYGVDGFTLSSSSQMWNVNGEVKAAEPTTSLSTVSIESLIYLEGYEVIELFEEDSFIYDVLRNKIQISEQSYYGYLDDEYEYGLYLNKQKQAMIPARSIIEQFGGSVSFNKAAGRIVLFDDATNTSIEIKAGSNIAWINGEQVEWAAAVEVIDGVTYVPARGIAEALQADVSWYNPGYLEITRIP